MVDEWCVALLIVTKRTSGHFQVLRGWQPCEGSATVRGVVCKVSWLGQLGWGWGKKQSGLDGGGRLGGSVGQMKGLSRAGLCMALIEFCVCGGGGGVVALYGQERGLCSDVQYGVK